METRDPDDCDIDMADEAQANARNVLARITGERPKNKAAVELGRLGGLKGGKARAAKLSPERRSEIAKKAVTAREAKRKKKA